VPFTPSHAIVALPFVRSRAIGSSSGIPAAIAVGAMTPDLPLFLRGTPIAYGWTHDVAWLPLTGLLALVLLLVWRCVLRPAARELSPRAIAVRLPEEWDAGAVASARETVAPTAWRDRPLHVLFPAVLAAALLFGVITHIVWDLFTHEGRAGMPALQELWGPLPGYRWLQYASSVVGLLVLAVWALRRLRRAKVAASAPRLLPAVVRWTWWLALPVILTLALVTAYAMYGPLTAEFTLQHLAYQVLPPACALWGGLTVALCIVVQALGRRPSRR
jgi:hypothetical protein